MSPLLSHIYESGLMEAVARKQKECFDAGVLFARSEGIIPAPEATHAIAEVVSEARACVESGEEKVIVMVLSGHGHLDLPAYGAYLDGSMTDHSYEESEIRDAVAEALTRLPAIPGQ